MISNRENRRDFTLTAQRIWGQSLKYKQRCVSRPSLDKIFSGQKAKGERDRSIKAAHMSHGYTLKEIADYLGIHYTTVSKVIAKAAVSKK